MSDLPGGDRDREMVRALEERAKELACLYRVDEILSRSDATAAELCKEIANALPPGWQYPEVCRARVRIEADEYRPPDLGSPVSQMTAPILVQGEAVGEVAVCYVARRPPAQEGPFLREERRLLDAIADRVSLFLLQRRLRSGAAGAVRVEPAAGREGGDWRVILDFLKRSDRKLLARLTRKMTNFLCWSGVREAERLLQEYGPTGATGDPGEDENRPRRRRGATEAAAAERTFAIGARELGDAGLLARLQLWMEEDRSAFLLDALEKTQSGLPEIADAVERYVGAGIQEGALPMAARRSLRVSLLRRVFTDQIDFLNVAKDYVQVEDFRQVLQRTIYPLTSHGKLGGKSAGLFLAMRVLDRLKGTEPEVGTVLEPRTWYVASDALLEFIHFNQLEDLYDRKYLDTEVIRREYPYLIQLFKSSRFPPEIDKGLSTALDDFEERPLIVRSSSLLEDRSGAAFSGKYKSLFLANQGSKRERLAALRDAIAEVYASIFSPDPIEYRAERGLLDVHEEMAIMIQEVVGRKVGRYFLPAFAGVAFSNNEFRWSHRIRREDGLARMVPGLGTRAVDRLSDDFPILIAPGQPQLKVNATADEVVRYSPRMIDVINLERNAFETVDARRLLDECRDDFPMVRRLVSIVEPDRLRPPTALEPDWGRDELVLDFAGLVSDGAFPAQLHAIMRVLREKLGTPVDIEFACDGASFYLVQCRGQSYRSGQAPAPIPRDLPRDRVVFSANRHISNGWVPDITHVVYVDPEGYAQLPGLDDLRDVGHAVSRLNKILPKRRFVLIGPGRWGSRGDIRLGVSVAYSDINNTAALLEVARRKGGYVPELSFGTHFFQDLVEADIRYIPLYPDEPGNEFQETFLRRSPNILAEMVPEFGRLGEVLRVIDVPRTTNGKVLRILLNADLDEALGVLMEPASGAAGRQAAGAPELPPSDEHWRWRLRMAERIAAHLEPARFGVKAIYVFGSAKNATSRPGSDLDLIVHVEDDEPKRQSLLLWLDAWSRSLAEINYLRTGYSVEGLLDVHLVTDEDIARRTSYAVKIDSVTDAALRLPLRGESPAR